MLTHLSQGKRPSWRLISLIGLLLIAVVVMKIWHSQAPEPHPSQEVRLWEERIHAVGGKDAYQEFSDSMKEIPSINQHFHAHAFGEALYATLGAPGFSICDDRFAYGCAHEFIAKSIAEKGTSGLASITASCPSDADFGATFGCFHGIGHGLLADSAYENADLSKTLEVCSGFGKDAKHCYDGAFMEYNMHTMLSGGKTVRDPKTQPFAPCDSLQERYQMYCFFRQTQWWQVALYGGEPRGESFSKMGELCRSEKDALGLKDDNACIAGLGFTALENSLHDLSAVRLLCDAGTIDDHEDSVCLAFAAAIRNFIHRENDGATLCTSLSPKSRSLCLLGAEKGIDALMAELN